MPMAQYIDRFIQNECMKMKMINPASYIPIGVPAITSLLQIIFPRCKLVVFYLNSYILYFFEQELTLLSFGFTKTAFVFQRHLPKLFSSLF